MSYQIITDSCCDFTDREYAQMNVTYVPLTVMWNGESHDHFSSTEALKDFYTQMWGGLVATTSALNPDNWARAMEPYLEAGKDLLVISVSSGISTTYQSAMIAAEELRERYPRRTSASWTVSAVLWAKAFWCGMPADSGTAAHRWKKTLPG